MKYWWIEERKRKWTNFLIVAQKWSVQESQPTSGFNIYPIFWYFYCRIIIINILLNITPIWLKNDKWITLIWLAMARSWLSELKAIAWQLVVRLSNAIIGFGLSLVLAWLGSYTFTKPVSLLNKGTFKKLRNKRWRALSFPTFFDPAINKKVVPKKFIKLSSY